MPFQISEKAYHALLKSLDALHTVEKVAAETDLNFLADDQWLSDTVVIDSITQRRGMWEIHLIFAHHKQPLKLLNRVITHTYCPKKAKITADLMKRLAAKDQRGTLKIDQADFSFDPN